MPGELAKQLLRVVDEARPLVNHADIRLAGTARWALSCAAQALYEVEEHAEQRSFGDLAGMLRDVYVASNVMYELEREVEKTAEKEAEIGRE